MTLATTQAFWFATRASGLVAVVLLTASVALGVAATARWTSDTFPRFVVQAIHRNVSLLALAMLVIHIVTTVVDSFAPISWIDAVVPFRSPYRPIWLGLSALSLDFMLAIIATSLVRRHIRHDIWQAIHYTSWIAWAIAIVHGLGTGSDTQAVWAQAVYIVCGAAGLVSLWLRLANGWPVSAERRIAVGWLSVVLPAVIVIWALAGPLRPGWARRAGTPAKLLGSASAQVSTVNGG